MNSEILFRVIQALILVGFIAHRAYYTRKYPPREGDTLEKQVPGLKSRTADLLAVLGLLATMVYLIAPRWIAWASLPLPVWLRWVGVLLTLLGFGLLQWSQNALGQNWSDQPRLLKDQEFITTGPYRWIRHPIYAAFLVILGSTLLITANWLVGGLWILSSALDISARISFEESRILAQFDAGYRDYCSRTGALFPRL